MARILRYLGISFVVSLFYFSFGFSFLPASINTKMALAVIGLGLSIIHAIQNGVVKISKSLLGAIGFVIVFSIACFISVDYNHTTDYSYATYFVSFAVWIFAAYTVCSLIRWEHNQITIKLITFYLAAVCLGQCVLAIMIDNIPILQLWVNLYINQGQEFLLEVGRLYGIGASLDNAGVRFSIVLIMMAAVIAQEEQVKDNHWQILFLLITFFSIIVIGNMISRTTSVGSVMAVIYFSWYTGLVKLAVKKDFFKFHFIFGSILLLSVLLIEYLYRVDGSFHDQIRFAFEGFFNWVEKGEWRTDSTDKLNSQMWVWPTDQETWIVGSGLFDNWIYGTDIGYCRFILYCGLIGFSIFAAFFAYNSIVLANRFSQYKAMFLFLFILTFVIWIKVSTDIFLIFALFYCMDMFSPAKNLNAQHESSLLYRRDI